RMIKFGARPEYAHILFNFFVSDPIVICSTAFGSNAQFIEYRLTIRVGKFIADTETPGDLHNNFGVGACPGRWIYDLTDPDNSSLGSGDRTFLFFVQRAW